jgi:hypothetical protein
MFDPTPAANSLRQRAVDSAGRDVDSNVLQVRELREYNRNAALHIDKLRENLHLAALEMASVRQELLGTELKNQKSVRDLRVQLEAQYTENTQLRNLNARHKGDGETKIAELSSTIRALSQRSDMHELLAEARQELELERLASHHLRSDVDGYRRLLEEEQRKVSQCA